MGQVRNGFNDIEGIAQWIGRKVRNHSPMSERVKGKHNVAILTEDPTKVIYQLPDGRRYEIAVREMDEDELYEATHAVGS